MKHKIAHMDKKGIFEVPDGYFDDLPLKIQQRIEVKDQGHSSQIASWRWAMVATILIVLSFLFIYVDHSATPEDILAEVSQEELVAYLDQIELDEYDIALVIDEESEMFGVEDIDVLDGINMSEQDINNVLLEYDLADEYL